MRTPAAHHSGVTRALQILGSDQLGQISNSAWASPKVKLSCRSVSRLTLCSFAFYLGEKGKGGSILAKKGPIGMCLGNPAASPWWLLLSSCPSVGNGSNSGPCLPFLMHRHMVATASVVHIATMRFLCARGKLDSWKNHPELLVSNIVAVSALEHPLHVHRSKL